MKRLVRYCVMAEMPVLGEEQESVLVDELNETAEGLFGSFGGVIESVHYQIIGDGEPTTLSCVCQDAEGQPCQC